MANKKNPKPFLLCNFSEMSGSVHQLVVGNNIFSTGEGPRRTHKLMGWLLKGFSVLNIFSKGTGAMLSCPSHFYNFYRLITPHYLLSPGRL